LVMFECMLNISTALPQAGDLQTPPPA
jgi:hypothetical protein